MTLRPLVLAVTLSLAGVVAAPSFAKAPDAKPAASASKSDKAAQLNALYDQYWEEVLKLNPLQATFQGDPRYNDQMPNFPTAVFRPQRPA